MKQLHKILKISAKEAFKNLRKNGPYFSSELQEKIFIGREFWNHINFSKYRTVTEIIFRLAIIPLIQKIIENGSLQSQRQEIHTFFRLEHTLSNETFCLIIMLHSLTHQYSLISCFVKYKQ